jgi:hypothetical protein
MYSARTPDVTRKELPMLSSISLDLAEELTHTITSYGPEVTDALIRLIRGISDPDGDKHRRQLAWVVVKSAMPFSSKFEEIRKEIYERRAKAIGR